MSDDVSNLSFKNGVQIKSLSNLFIIVRNLKIHNLDTYFYRGQSNYDWNLTPSIYRNREENFSEVIVSENKFVKQCISSFPNEFLNEKFMVDKLAKLAHFGFPTRLLDVTKNIMVALYFACNDEKSDVDGALYTFSCSEYNLKYYDSDGVSILANIANLNSHDKELISDTLLKFAKDKNLSDFNKNESVEKLIYYIQQDNKPYFKAFKNPNSLLNTIYYQPTQNNMRLVSQSGAFLMFGFQAQSLDLTEKFNNRIFGGYDIKKHKVCKEAKSKIISELRSFNISEEKLFPELEYLSKELKEKYTSFRIG